MGRSQGKNKKLQNVSKARGLIFGQNSTNKEIGTLKTFKEQSGLEILSIFKEFQKKANDQNKASVLDKSIIAIIKDIDISKKDLSGLSFNGINFQNVNGAKATFYKIDSEEIKPVFQDLEMNNSNFEEAQFSTTETNPGVDFINVASKRSNFKKALLNSSKIQSSKFFKTNFSESYLKKSDIENSFFEACDFTKTTLSGSVITGPDQYETNQKKEVFSKECVLNETDLSGCQIRKVIFNENELIKVQLNESEIQNCEFKDVNFQNTNMSESFIFETSFSPKEGSRIDMSYSDLSYSKFAPNSKVEIDFTNVSAENSDFNKVDLEKSDLQGAVFKDCDFYNANLSQVKNIENATFIDCQLEEVKMPPSVVSGLIKLNIESEFE